MRHLGTWILALAVAAVALIASPLPVFQKQRIALAHMLVAEGFAVVGSLVYVGVASSGDPVAKNNLGVLRFRGIGGQADLDAAQRLFAEAAALGSSQAATNLAVADSGGCGLNHASSAETVRRLEAPVAEGNASAAAQTIDCLYFDAARNRVGDSDGAMIAASLAVASDDGPGRLKSGRALVNAARSVQLPGHPGSPSQEEYDSRVVRLIDRGSIDLFAAAELGQPQAYEWLGVIRHQFQKVLPRLKLGDRIKQKTYAEWTAAGAGNGDWTMVCRTASRSLEELLGRVGRYSRAEFDTAVATAHECLERETRSAATEWYMPAEYPAVKPHEAHSEYPTLDIGRTADALKRLLFQDAAATLQNRSS